jgi:hypothetical protein
MDAEMFELIHRRFIQKVSDIENGFVGIEDKVFGSTFWRNVGPWRIFCPVLGKILFIHPKDLTTKLYCWFTSIGIETFLIRYGSFHH